MHTIKMTKGMLNWKGSGLIELLPRHFPAGSEKNHGKPVRITGVPVEN
jgi:hypothetical protein